VTLQVRRTGEWPWTAICAARLGDPIGLAGLDSQADKLREPGDARFIARPTRTRHESKELSLLDDTAPVAMSPPIAAVREAAPPIAMRRDLVATRGNMLMPKTGTSKRRLLAKCLIGRGYTWIEHLSRYVATGF
jgi:hypothetical protein